MKLADAKQRAVDSAVRNYRDRRARDVLGAAVLSIGSGVLFLSTLLDPADWAKGDLFKPGNAVHDALGSSGTVLLVRGGLAVLTLLSTAWLLRVIGDITWGLAARRTEIAANMRTFDPPDRREPDDLPRDPA